MPELPEVEVLRRTLEHSVRGRTIARVTLSGLRLRTAIPRSFAQRVQSRTIRSVRRRGKYLLIELDGDLTLLSHLGMTGWWWFHRTPPPRRDGAHTHVHARLHFRDGTALWFEDSRRFGLLRAVRTPDLDRDPGLAILGPDPLASPLSAAALVALARGRRVSVKAFLLDQRRIAGIGNIYASEILFRARVDPRRRAGALSHAEWERIAASIEATLLQAIENLSLRSRKRREGAAGEEFCVYGMAGRPCPRCGTRIRRIVQGQRATFFCPVCQRR